MRKQLINYIKLRGQLEFGAVLSHYNIAYPTGKTQIKILCPFHEEDTPSCSINVPDSKWQCFGCQAAGNALEFVVMMEGGEPADKADLYAGALKAIEILGRQPSDFKMERVERSKSPQERVTAKKRPSSRSGGENSATDDSDASAEPIEPLANPVLDLTLSLDPSHPYLTDTRGLDANTIATFGMGFASRGIMKDRIAIPIHNATGGLVAYAGRWAADELPPDTERYRLPKAFHKSLELYNLHRAIALACDRRKIVVVVEGFWSAIRLHQAGIPAVALMGDSVSPAQAKLLRESGFKFAVLILDGDEAGRNAQPKAAGILADQLYIHSIELDEGVKPDTMPDSLIDRLR